MNLLINQKNKGSRFIKTYSDCIKCNPECSKGFTLIELLVVIAIIGILASVVLASLSSARVKGKAAAIQSVMSSLRAQAEIGITSNGKYVPNLCKSASSQGGLWTLLESIDPTFSPKAKAKRLLCGQNISASDILQPTAWGAQVDLPTDPVTTFCVDSTGYAGLIEGTQPIVAIEGGSISGVKCIK